MSCWAFMGTSSFIWSIIRLATEVSPSWQGSFLSWCSGISNTLATTSIILFKAELEERFLPAEMTALFTNSPGPSHPNWTRLGLSAPYPIREHFTILWVWLESGALYPLFTEEPYFADPLPTVLCYSDSSTHTDKSEKINYFTYMSSCCLRVDTLFTRAQQMWGSIFSLKNSFKMRLILLESSLV